MLKWKPTKLFSVVVVSLKNVPCMYLFSDLLFYFILFFGGALSSEEGEIWNTGRGHGPPTQQLYKP